MTYTYDQLNDAVFRIIDYTAKNLNKIPESKYKEYGIKMTILFVKEVLADKDDKPKTLEHIKFRFHEIEQIKKMLSGLTLNEFMNVFPIRKEFDGDKTGCKDYYSTMEFIKDIPKDELIGEKIDELIMEYVNDDIEKFMFRSMDRLSDLMEATTGQSLGAKFAKDMGIPTMTLHEDDQGRKYMIDENGRSMPVVERKKRMPKYLKVVK